MDITEAKIRSATGLSKWQIARGWEAKQKEETKNTDIENTERQGLIDPAVAETIRRLHNRRSNELVAHYMCSGQVTKHINLLTAKRRPACR